MPNRISAQRPFGTDTGVDVSSGVVQQEVCHEASTIANAMGALGLEPRSASLDGQHSHAMPPRRAVLRWPNRDVSLGHLTGSLASGLTFQPSSITGPLGERGSEGRLSHLTLTEFSPHGIEVVPLPGSEVSELPWVRPKLLDTVPGVDQAVLTNLADVASGVGKNGTPIEDQRVLATMLSAALSSIEAGSEDLVAVRRARDALDRNSPYIRASKPAGVGDEYLWLSDAFDYDADKMLQSLGEGEHLLMRSDVTVFTKGGHALAISATRLEEENVRLSVFNSNGWADRSPAAFKTMPLPYAAAALQAIGGDLFGPAVNLPQQAHDFWEHPGAGMPLLSWLHNAGPHESMPQLSEQRMASQKSGDCGVEVQFAWLASVLPHADYKMAKAHVLNVLAQAAKTAGRSEPELLRLQDRITTSLSGYAMSPPLKRTQQKQVE
jgi:hypothetical protein